MLSKEKIAEVVGAHQRKAGDTGSTEVQIALLSTRIKDLQQAHFSIHKKDVHSRMGLMKLVSQRRRLLKYLKKSDLSKYRELIEQLEIRG